MKQLVFRIASNKNDVEMIVDENGESIFKSMDKKSFIKIINRRFAKIKVSHSKPKLINKNIYAEDSGCVVILQNERYRIVPYKSKSYKILFPNSVYLIRHTGTKVDSIEAFAYKKFNEQKTVLYKYPMPNMLSGNRICIGTANTKILKNIETTLECILCTEFTHNHVNEITGFKDTKKYFEYLTKNKFPYDLLIKTNLKVGDLVDE